jgi:spore maturation protein CgeB
MKQEPILFKGNHMINIERLYKNIRNTFTYEFWVKPSSSIDMVTESIEGVSGMRGQRYIIGPGYGEDEDAGFGVSVGTNGVIVYEHGAAYLPALLVYPISITDWTHIAVVYRNKTPYLYINGDLKKKGLTSQKENVYGSGLFGGLDPYGYYSGYVKDLKIWNYDRSDAEIKANMDKTLTGNEEGLFAYCPFHREKSYSSHVDPSFKNNSKILLIKSGNDAPYPPLEHSIIKTLKNVVRKLKVVTPADDLINISTRLKPDLAIHFSPVISLEINQIEELKKLGIKTALWLTDDPYYTDITKLKAPLFDVVFTQEMNCVPVYQLFGCRNVHFLPLAADPDVFHPKTVNSKYQSDILFVGSAFWNRVNLFDSIAEYLNSKNFLIMGQNWERLKNYELLKDKILDTWASPEETASYYNGAKIVINNHRSHDDSSINFNSRNIKAISVNPRTFEISACGAFQLTDVREDLTSFYTPGVDLATYDSPYTLIQKIEYYLSHEAERNAIALNGLKKTRTNHTFLNRINQLLDIALPK